MEQETKVKNFKPTCKCCNGKDSDNIENLISTAYADLGILGVLNVDSKIKFHNKKSFMVTSINTVNINETTDDLVVVDELFDFEKQIMYCPMCGRKLPNSGSN